eukprot:7535649-Karenia_brevis.AAC.1
MRLLPPCEKNLIRSCRVMAMVGPGGGGHSWQRNSESLLIIGSVPGLIPQASQPGTMCVSTRPLQAMPMHADAVPVSYTHLTLPTICSV